MIRRPSGFASPTSFVFAAAGASAVAVFGGGNPFPWIWLSWTWAFAGAAFLCRERARAAAVLLMLAGASGVLLGFELYCGGRLAAFGLTPPGSMTAEDRPHANSLDESLGYVPVKNLRTAIRRTRRGEAQYDPPYSIDENGFRRTPPLPAAAPAVVFFGDSFTFGEGLSDAETFPAVVQSMSGYKAINLAYMGYGPHQMLRILETGREIPATARYRPFQAFYLFVPDHVARAAGNAWWDPAGPRYEIDGHGELRYRGPWRGVIAAGAWRVLFRSAILRRYWGAAWSPQTKLSEERFAAIVANARRLFKDRYGGDLDVLLWDGTPPRIAALLRRHDVPVIPLADALPEVHRRELYFDHGHPNAVLSRALGAYLARWIAARPRQRPVQRAAPRRNRGVRK